MMVPLRSTTTQHRLSVRLPRRRPDLQHLRLRRRTGHISTHHMDMGEVHPIVEEVKDHIHPEGAVVFSLTYSQNVAGEYLSGEE